MTSMIPTSDTNDISKTSASTPSHSSGQSTNRTPTADRDHSNDSDADTAGRGGHEVSLSPSGEDSTQNTTELERRDQESEQTNKASEDQTDQDKNDVGETDNDKFDQDKTSEGKTDEDKTNGDKTDDDKTDVDKPRSASKRTPSPEAAHTLAATPSTTATRKQRDPPTPANNPSAGTKPAIEHESSHKQPATVASQISHPTALQLPPRFDGILQKQKGTSFQLGQEFEREQQAARERKGRPPQLTTTSSPPLDRRGSTYPPLFSSLPRATHVVAPIKGACLYTVLHFYFSVSLDRGEVKIQGVFAEVQRAHDAALQFQLDNRKDWEVMLVFDLLMDSQISSPEDRKIAREETNAGNRNKKLCSRLLRRSMRDKQ